MKVVGALALTAVLVMGCDGSGASSDSSASESGSGGAGSGAGSSSGGNGAGGLMLGTGGGGGGNTGGGSQCDGLLNATVRDFSTSHPDFEVFGGTMAFTGIVDVDIGADQKPVYAHPGGTAQTTGPAEYAQWYNDTANVNFSFSVPLQLIENPPGEFTYDNSAFFPVDGMGFDNEGNPHNFHFTTEIHTVFTYEGGEVFTFTGDDDLWMFINGKLAIDLGGLHPQLSASIDLDTFAGQLGITIGQTYPMDIFHAERHTTESNFRIQTTIACFQQPPS